MQLREGRKSADRRVGIVIEGAESGVVVTGVVVHVVPGIPNKWGRFLLNAFGVLAYLAVGMLALFQRGEDIRGRLLVLFTVAVAMEMALPQQDLVGFATLTKVAEALFYVLTAVQFGRELHLASAMTQALFPACTVRRLQTRRGRPASNRCGRAARERVDTLAGVGRQAPVPDRLDAEEDLLDVRLPDRDGADNRCILPACGRRRARRSPSPRSPDVVVRVVLPGLDSRDHLLPAPLPPLDRLPADRPPRAAPFPRQQLAPEPLLHSRHAGAEDLGGLLERNEVAGLGHSGASLKGLKGDPRSCRETAGHQWVHRMWTRLWTGE